MTARTIKVNGYEVLCRAVEDGVERGYRKAQRACISPTEDAIKSAIEIAVMDSLCDVLLLKEETEPDISMCSDGDCPSAEACYRFTATPDKSGQSYITTNRHPQSNDCRYFMPNGKKAGEG